jgi:hypothetical protein
MDALGTITKRKEAMVTTPISGYAVYHAEPSRGPAGQEPIESPKGRGT